MTSTGGSSSSSNFSTPSPPAKMTMKLMNYESNIYAYKNTLRHNSSSSSSSSSETSSRSVSLRTKRSVFRIPPKTETDIPKPTQTAQTSKDTADSACCIKCNCAKSIAGESCIVPPLDISSDSEHLSEHYAPCTGLKRDPQVAFETWLSAKRRIFANRTAQLKALREKMLHEQEERRRLAKARYDQWLAEKREKAAREKKQPDDKEKQMREKRSRRFNGLTEEERDVRLKLWIMGKNLKIERERLLKITINTLERHYRIERKRLADEAFKKWSRGVGSKPKPVPMNCGLYSLRGTINKLYINPNEWQPIIAGH